MALNDALGTQMQLMLQPHLLLSEPLANASCSNRKGLRVFGAGGGVLSLVSGAQCPLQMRVCRAYAKHDKGCPVTVSIFFDILTGSIMIIRFLCLDMCFS